jgi:DNA-binding NarL/FixJ family response regulator
MSDRPLKLLLIDQDPIFRLGLRVALEVIPDIEVISEAETDTTALQILAELSQNDPNRVNLVVLELGNGHSISSQQLGLQLCRHLKIQYPNLPVLLLSATQEQGILLAAKAAGVNGFCPKGVPVAELVTVMEEVVAGRSFWYGDFWGQGATEQGSRGSKKQRGRRIPITPYPQRGLRVPQSLIANPHYPLSPEGAPSSPIPLSRLRSKLRFSGEGYIKTSLEEVTAKLQVPGLPLLEQAILAGRRRELLAARWLLDRLLTSSLERQQVNERVSYNPDFITSDAPQSNYFTTESSQVSTDLPSRFPYSDFLKTPKPPVLLSPRALQAELFALCVTKIQFPLQNLTDVALEIDILREDKKRELLYLILQKVADTLDKMRDSHVEMQDIGNLKETVLFDIWRESTIDFFGKFSKIRVSDRSLEIVNLLLENPVVVQREILNKIPFFDKLFSYLLFQTDLQVDNNSYPPDSSEAKEQAENILENILIQIANGVIQPLLNSLSDVEAIKQNFYTRQFISTRELEKFRNNLSWKYRLIHYVSEPQAIFESRFELFVFAPRGIAKISIYAPRSQELARLSGIPLVVTLAIEFRDALTPRLQSLLSFLGNGVVFVLTRIIGRGIGLIARGIIQGIGNVSLRR